MLLRKANRCCLRLWKDESGVALAVTVIMFLSLFMIASAVYAVGEVVRQRVEIQNAADAAAYSGAITQADTISRIAALNRAMAWTYAQHVRMEMDAIEDRWLEIVVQKWFPDYAKVRAKAATSECAVGPFTGWDDWYCGSGYFQREHVLINKRIWVSIYKIVAERAAAAGAGKSWYALLPQIQYQHWIIKKMNTCEDELVARMPERIFETVRDVVKKNVKDTENDEMAGGADFMFNLKQEQSAEENFEFLRNTLEEETLFLNYADLKEPPEEFGQGAYEGQWFVRKPEGQEGIQRRYVQRFNMLVAEWNWWGRRWKLIPGDPPACVPADFIQGRTEVKGQDGWNDIFYITEKCLPRKIKRRFFAKGGAIVVGVTRRVNNPWFYTYGSPSEEGIFKPYSLDNENRFMWCGAAAIAGHNLNGPSPSNGEFDPTYWPPDKEKYNLKYSDWDAVLLPLHRAWAKGENRQWSGETGGEILNALKGGWMPVYGGGGALGAQGAPEIMQSGGTVNYGACEKLIVH